MVKLSVITVCYNEKHRLERTIKSVAAQDYPEIEHIIIDGGSSDGSIDIINSHAQSNCKWISEKDNGVYDAMNKGIDLASGDWINFLNAGDCYHNDNIVKKVLSSKKPDTNLIYGDTYLFSSKHEPIRRLNAEILTRKTIRKGMIVCHQAIFVKKDIMPKYNLSFKLLADYSWLIDIMKNNNVNLVYINIPVVNYELGGLSQKRFINNFIEHLSISSKEFGHKQLIRNIPRYLRTIVGHYLRVIYNRNTLRPSSLRNIRNTL